MAVTTGNDFINASASAGSGTGSSGGTSGSGPSNPAGDPSSTQPSTPPSTLPPPRYVAIALDSGAAPLTPLTMNSNGSVLLSSPTTGTPYLWSSSSSGLGIPIPAPGGMDNVSWLNDDGLVTGTDSSGQNLYVWNSSAGRSLSSLDYSAASSALDSYFGYVTDSPTNTVASTPLIGQSGDVYDNVGASWGPGAEEAENFVEAGGAYEWLNASGSATPVGVLYATAAGGSSELSATPPDSGIEFTPKAIASGPYEVVIGTGVDAATYHQSDTYYDGAFHPLSTGLFAQAVNSNGEVLAYDGAVQFSSPNSSVSISWGGSVAPTGASWNASHQIVADKYLWEPATNSVAAKTTLLDRLVDTSSGWSGITVAQNGKPNLGLENTGTWINDSGAIVGTATYSGTSYPTGQHGVMLIPLTIQINNQPITSSNNTVVVGEQVNLSISSPAATPTAYNWTLPGTTFTSYTASASSGTLNQFQTNDPNLKQQSVSFYWADGGDNRQVKCDVTVYGQVLEVTANLNVKRPTASIQAQGSSVSLNDRYLPPPFIQSLYLGGPTLTGPGGISFTETITPPSGFDFGTFEWVQIKNYGSASITANGTTYSLTATPGTLDHTYPYDTASPTEDSPGLSFKSTSDTPDSVVGNYTMYLMWMPSLPNSQWVPLRKVTWGWSGACSYASGSWNLDSNTPPGNPADSDTTTHPIWTSNASDDSFSPPLPSNL